MTRIAPYAQQQLALFNILRTQERLYDAQLQVATGQKSQTYGGIAADSARLLSVEASLARARQYTANIDTAQRRLDLADLSVAGIEEIARDLQDLLDTAVDAPAYNHNTVRQYATNAISLLTELLNAQDGDRYLFSGQRVDQAAVDLAAGSYTPVGLIASDGVTVDPGFYADYRANVLGSAGYPQGSFYEQIFFDKNGVAPTAPLPADLDNPTLSDFVGEDPDLWTYYVSRLSSPEMLANPKLDYFGGSVAQANVQITATTSVSYGITAAESSIQQLIIGLDTIARLPDGAPADAFLGTVFAQVKDMLDPIINADPASTLKTVSELRVKLNGPVSLFKDTRARHTEFVNYAQTTISDIERADPAEAITLMQADQIALEASYSALARVQTLSLVNFLN
jgi:flagellin-like hook-associated protein FlgL